MMGGRKKKYKSDKIDLKMCLNESFHVNSHFNANVNIFWKK